MQDIICLFQIVMIFLKIKMSHINKLQLYTQLRLILSQFDSLEVFKKRINDFVIFPNNAITPTNIEQVNKLSSQLSPDSNGDGIDIGIVMYDNSISKIEDCELLSYSKICENHIENVKNKSVWWLNNSSEKI